MKFISWNVNGLRAVVGKNFLEAFNALDADFFCLQETKLQEGRLTWIYPVISHIGTMPRRKDTAARPSSHAILPCPYHTAWA